LLIEITLPTPKAEIMGSIRVDDQMATNQSLLQKTGKTQAAFVPKLYMYVSNSGLVLTCLLIL
jgi:hypothetical protein